MMRSLRLFPILLLLLFSSCGGIRKEEKLRAELLSTDRAFSMLSAEQGMNRAFETYCDDEGVLLRPGRRPVEGKAAIADLLNQNADSAFRLTWEPLFASVSASGDLGYTYGTYELLILKTGETSRGTYLSVWSKGSDGWKFVVDTGNEGLGEGPTASWWRPGP
jgi:hypothetical protein